MLTLKLSAEQMEKLGIKTQDEALALLEGAGSAKAELAAANTTLDGFRAELSALTEKVTALESRKPELSAEDMAKIQGDCEAKAEAKAKSTAQAETAAVLAKFGGKPAGQGETPADVTSQQAIADDDYAGQWKANVGGCHDEFSSFDAFAAYKKAEAKGAFKLYKGK